jgi:hypothetical protein
MYSEKIYEGPEAMVVTMDIGTVQSELASRGRSKPEPVFQAQYRSRALLHILILEVKRYFTDAIVILYLTVESGYSLARPSRIQV